MTKAEEKALEVYPIKMTPLVYQDLIDQFGGKTEIDVNTYPRCLFQEGYAQAEEDLIDRLVEFYPTLDYTFRSYMLQAFPELKGKIEHYD